MKIDENIIKNVKNRFRLKKEMDDTTMKDMRNLFKFRKEIGTFLSMKKKVIINQ